MMRIGEVLMKWRLMSQREIKDVATEINISATTLGRMEKGRSLPDAQTIIKVMWWLFRTEDEHGDSQGAAGVAVASGDADDDKSGYEAST